MNGSSPVRPGVVVGTAGHVDHGKTSLVRALTGTETDRWEEERRRGLTIDIGFARLESAERDIGIVDVPGHEDFLKNMLAGATGLDGVILVVAADEGPMPQTHEHLEIMRLLGVTNGVVALTKIDRVEAEWRELVHSEVESLVRGVIGQPWPIIGVSSTSGEGVEGLRSALEQMAGQAPVRESDDLFRMPVDRAFTIRGTGTVTTGTVWSGQLAVGEEVRILPGHDRARVRALQVHGGPRERVGAGRRCAVALVGLEPAAAPRGTCLVVGDAWTPVSRLGARVSVLSRPGRPVVHGQRLRVFHATREVMARVLLAGEEAIAPGDEAPVVLALEAPLVASVRDRMVLRFYSPVTTIAGARVAELAPPARWHRRAEGWNAILDAADASSVVAAVRATGRAGVPLSRLPLVTGLPLRVATQWAEEAPGLMRLGDNWFARQEFDKALATVGSAIDRLHAATPRATAVSLGAVRETAARSSHPALVDAALVRLESDGEIVIDGARTRRPDHEPRLTDTEAGARDRLIDVIARGGLQPPLVSELEAEIHGPRALLDDLLSLLRDQGMIVPVTSELYLSREAIESAERKARELLRGGRIAAPTAFKEAWGVSRKYLIPLLEYLDEQGVTRRTGDGRTSGETQST